MLDQFKIYMETFANNTAEQDFLLTFPIRLKLTNSRRYSGFYHNSINADTDITTHVIKVSTFFNPIHDKMEETIIHELIHAWQYEQGKRVGHGKSFKKWAQYFKSFGYGVR